MTLRQWHYAEDERIGYDQCWTWHPDKFLKSWQSCADRFRQKWVDRQLENAQFWEPACFPKNLGCGNFGSSVIRRFSMCWTVNAVKISTQAVPCSALSTQRQASLQAFECHVSHVFTHLSLLLSLAFPWNLYNRQCVAFSPPHLFLFFCCELSQPLNVHWHLTFKVGLDILYSVSDMIPPFSHY